MITVSKEDYLKAILEAESEGETVISATLASVPALNSGHRDTRATAWFGGDPMFDLLYVILIIVLLAISIAMIRFFERL